MSMSVQKSQDHKKAKITRWRKEIMVNDLKKLNGGRIGKTTNEAINLMKMKEDEENWCLLANVLSRDTVIRLSRNSYRIVPNTGKQEKKRRTCGDYRKYEESHVRIKCGSISKKKKSNYSSFQDLRSSYNRDMVKYKGPRPSTTQARALNEKSSKKIPPATSQPPGWRVCRQAEGVPPGRRLCLSALGAHIFHFTLEETWKAKKDLDPLNRLWTPL
ncbi:hypothetical protein Tco_0796230 [Tanacetum coccineum]